MIRESLFLPLLFFAPVMRSQPVYPPPPPPEKPVTPVRIIVGDKVQAATPPVMLGGRWLIGRAWGGKGGLLSQAWIERFERTLVEDPRNVCARGLLIAVRPEDPVYRELADIRLTRVDHLAKMIQLHPEWDGFGLDPASGIWEPRSPRERDSDIHNRLRALWLDQIAPDQVRAMVLHNAAMFFAIREPVLAARLLARAISIDPKEQLYVERLGVIYAYLQIPHERLVKFGVIDTPERLIFSPYARALLLSSQDSTLVRAASLALTFLDWQASKELSRALRAKADALSPSRSLPSASDRFDQPACKSALALAPSPAFP